MRRAFCAAALLTLACLLPRAVLVGLAGDYLDPIGKITAGAEARYAAGALAMVRGSGSPGRGDSPLLLWCAAASMRVFGPGGLALRLPVTLFAAIAVALIFLWGAEAAGLQAGASAALLVLGNHLFHTLSTLCLPDAL